MKKFFPFLLEPHEAPDMLRLLNRSLNTMDPKDWPKWVRAYVAGLEKFIADGKDGR